VEFEDGAVKLALTAILSLLAAFAAITWWALESEGVAIIQTRPPDGPARSTHVWYAESNGELWLEAGTPQNGWFVDIQGDPELIFTLDDRSERYAAVPVDEPLAHSRIRSLIRQKYGFRDWWVGLIVDTSRSVAVRLTPRGSAPSS
jgi:hypothetical protein